MRLSTLGSIVAGIAILALTATAAAALPIKAEQAVAQRAAVGEPVALARACRQGLAYGYCRFRQTGRIARGCCRI